MGQLSGVDLPAARVLQAYPSVQVKPQPSQDHQLPWDSLVAWIFQLQVALPATCIMGRSSFYKSPSTKLRNQRRLSQYLKQKLSTCLVPAKVAKPNQLSKPAVSTTSYPEPCIVCKKHQCEWDVMHAFSYTAIEAINSAFDSAMERRFFKSSEDPPD